MMRALMQSVVRVAAGIAGLELMGLMLGEMAMNWGGATSLARRALPAIRSCWRVPSLLSLFATARRYDRFFKFEVPSTLLDSISIGLPLPIVVMLYGAAAGGLFALSMRMSSFAIAQLGAAVGDAVQMKCAESIRARDWDAARRLFWSGIGKLTPIAVGIGIVTGVLAPLLFGRIFGAKWSDAGWITLIVQPWVALGLIIAPFGRLFSVMQRQELKLVYDISQLVLTVGALVLASRLHLGMLSGIGLISAAAVLGYAIYFAMLVFAISLGPRIKSTMSP